MLFVTILPVLIVGDVNEVAVEVFTIEAHHHVLVFVTGVLTVKADSIVNVV